MEGEIPGRLLFIQSIKRQMSIGKIACNFYHIQGVISEAGLFMRKSEGGHAMGDEGATGPRVNWQVAWEWRGPSEMSTLW